jgi:hypothetical protein
MLGPNRGQAVAADANQPYEVDPKSTPWPSPDYQLLAMGNQELVPGVDHPMGN